MRILFFGSYNPDYSRNRVVLRALKAAGVEIIECHSQKKGWRKYVDLFRKHWRLRDSYDVFFVAFPGQELMFLAKLIVRKPIVFDAFTSHYAGYILDRAYFSKRSLRALYYRFVDTWSCHLADMVLLDTATHIEFFVKEFGLPREKFRCVWVGTDTSVFQPRPQPKKDHFLVHFHGHYIPVQGVEHILKAAKILELEKDIRFNLIGRGQQYAKMRKLADELELTNVDFIDEVPYEKLPDYIAQADVCLGLLGDTPRLEAAIANKVFEALAMQRAVINADTAAIRELLVDRESILACHKADAQDLAKKIRLLRDEPSLRQRIAEKGHEVFQKHCTEAMLGRELLAEIQKL